MRKTLYRWAGSSQPGSPPQCMSRAARATAPVPTSHRATTPRRALSRISTAASVTGEAPPAPGRRPGCRRSPSLGIRHARCRRPGAGGASPVTLAAVEMRLKARRGVVALWLVGTGAVALAALLMHWGGLPGWDDPAHLYKVFLIRDGQSVFWDNYWYGGGYGAITYGFVFYWLAQFVPAKLIVVLAAGALPALFYIYQRDMWRLDDVWPAWLLAGVMVAYLAHGQDPFVLALALTFGGLAPLARGHPLWAALPVVIGIFVNPMGLVVAATFMVADVLGRPGLRRRYVAFAAAAAPFVVIRVILGWAFTEPGAYLNQTSQLLIYLGFALTGVALAGVNAVHPRRPGPR